MLVLETFKQFVQLFFLTVKLLVVKPCFFLYCLDFANNYKFGLNFMQILKHNF